MCLVIPGFASPDMWVRFQDAREMISVENGRTPLKKWDNQVLMPGWILHSVNLAPRYFCHLGNQLPVSCLSRRGQQRNQLESQHPGLLPSNRSGCAIEIHWKEVKIEITFIYLNLKLYKKLRIWLEFLHASFSLVIQMLQNGYSICGFCCSSKIWQADVECII